MRIGAAIGLAVLIILMVVQIGVFYRRDRALEDGLAQVSNALKQADAEYTRLESDYQYYQNPANLEKELRARFNYKRPDEELIVIVPKATTTSPSPQ